MTPIISVIIPAYNEEDSIGRVLNDLPQEKLKEIIVVNNASTDNTAEVARLNGAKVVEERRRGYGAACLRGISEVSGADIVVFIDGDYSDYPEELDQLIKPILENRADFVLGSRMIYLESREALLPQARYGNKLATFLMRIFLDIALLTLGLFEQFVLIH